MMPPLPIDHLVESLVAAYNAPLPVDIDALTRLYLVDSIGVGLAGTTTLENAQLRTTAREWEPGGTGATIWGRSNGSRGPLTAAMANAHAVHNLEFDCVHEGAVLHPFTVVLPVLAAFTEREQHARGRTFTGDAFLRALSVGVELVCRLGEAATTGLRFFRPATAGHLGAAFALGLLDGRTHDELVAALGIAFGQASGSMQSHREGSPLLALQMAFAARNAICAHDLAGVGFTGPRAMLEPPLGYFGLIEEAGDVHRLLADIGPTGRWELRGVSHKPFPSGRATHATLSTLRDLRTQHGLTPDNVASIELVVPPLINHLVGRGSTDTMTAPYARLCVPFLAGLLLRDGDIGVDALTPANLSEPSLLQFSSSSVRIRVSDSGMDPNAFVPQYVKVTMTDGRAFEVTVTDTLGSPTNPLTLEQHLGKATSNAAACVRHGGASVDMIAVAALVDGLGTVDDVTPLWRSLALTFSPTIDRASI